MARFLLLGFIIALVVWCLRRPPRAAKAAPPKPARGAPPQEMVACELCGVHLPRTDALPGRSGVFCCEEHRNVHDDGK